MRKISLGRKRVAGILRFALLVAVVFGALETRAVAATGGTSLAFAQGENVELVGQIGGACYAVVVQGNYAYIHEGRDLRVVDVSQPESPKALGWVLLSGFSISGVAEGLAVSGSLAYVADGDRLQIIDASNLVEPVPRGSYHTPDDAHSVVVSGSLAYVADGYSGLQIIDVSNPAAPLLKGSYDTPGNAIDVFVSGSLAYVADGDRLQIVDVSNPAAPVLMGSYDTPGWAIIVFVSGSLAYVADGWSGLQIVDVSNPAAPVRRGSYDTPGWALNVFVSGSLAYVADRDSLQIIDVSNPDAPVRRGSYDTPGRAVDVFVSGSLAYVGDGEGGLLILRYTGEQPIPTNTPTVTNTPIISNTPTQTLTPPPTPTPLEHPTHYVSTTGSNTFPYDTWETAARKIQDAINATEPGDSVQIAEGVFHERITARADLTISGMGQDKTTINGGRINQEDVVVTVPGFCRIWNLKIMCDSSYGGCGIAAGYGVDMRNCEIDGFPAGYLGNFGTGFSIGDNSYVDDCLFVGNHRNYSGGIIRGSVFENCDLGLRLGDTAQVSYCAFLGCGTGAVEDTTVQNGSAKIVNCLFFGNGTAIVGGSGGSCSNCTIVGNNIGYCTDAWHSTLKNSIVYNNIQFGIDASGGYQSYVSLSHNDVWNNGQNYRNCSPDADSISLNPRFVSNTYYLSHTDAGQQYNSPCIDAGDFDIALNPLLVGWTTRTDGQPDTGTVDLGFHYPPSLPSTPTNTPTDTPTDTPTVTSTPTNTPTATPTGIAPQPTATETPNSDLNGDKRVDEEDLILLMGQWHNIVDEEDLLLLMRQWHNEEPERSGP